MLFLEIWKTQIQECNFYCAYILKTANDQQTYTLSHHRPVTVSTVSTLSPPTLLLTMHRYLPLSSTIASLMINVPPTWVTIIIALFLSFSPKSHWPASPSRPASPISCCCLTSWTCTTCNINQCQTKPIGLTKICPCFTSAQIIA